MKYKDLYKQKQLREDSLNIKNDLIDKLSYE